MDSAVSFFTKLGFKAVDRATAPPAILASRQAAELCPASTALMSRQIGF
jgi:arsenate reductase